MCTEALTRVHRAGRHEHAVDEAEQGHRGCGPAELDDDAMPLALSEADALTKLAVDAAGQPEHGLRAAVARLGVEE